MEYYSNSRTINQISKSKSQKAARQLYKEKETDADKIIKIAMGFYADKPEYLRSKPREIKP